MWTRLSLALRVYLYFPSACHKLCQWIIANRSSLHNSGTTQRQLKQLMAQRIQMSTIQLNSLDSKEITLNSTNTICKTQHICKMQHNYLVSVGIVRFISFTHVEAPHQENWNLCKIYLHAIAMRAKVQELWICLICKSIVAASKYCVVVTWLWAWQENTAGTRARVRVRQG